MREHGLVALFGSGETSADGRKVYEWVMKRLAPPIRAAVLETPAGFQPNSALVAGKVADFIRERMAHYRPQVEVIPARQRGTSASPDDAGVVAPLFSANLVFLGPGSPTYTVRQLRDSLAWQAVVARHRLGAALVLASAATVAVGAHVIRCMRSSRPAWTCIGRPAWTFLGPMASSSSLCRTGTTRRVGPTWTLAAASWGGALCPPAADAAATATVVGIDEHTALVVDLQSRTLRVIGKGCITLVNRDGEQRCTGDEAFDLGMLGDFHLPVPGAGLPAAVWARAQEVPQEPSPPAGPPDEVLALVQEREAARSRRDWAASDALRQEIAARGCRCATHRRDQS